MASLDHVERVFLGCDGPALPVAVDWLLRERGLDGGDLSGVLVVVPGGRAQRRLMELLVQRAAEVGCLLVPPQVVTMGGLADRLLPRDGSLLPQASGLSRVLGWAAMLRDADEALLSQIVPKAPQRDDWPGWWSLAEQVVRAADELATHRLTVGDVVGKAIHAGDVARWEALARLAERYEGRLAEQGLVDRNRAWLMAAEAKACVCDQRVVLLGVADLSPMLTEMLVGLGSPVDVLIAGDEADAAGFDGLGGLAEGHWAERELPIADEAIEVCDGPSDQAGAVLEAVRCWAAGDNSQQAGGVSADEITIGLGDEALAGAVERTLSLAGLPVRTAAGRPMGLARPVQLLQALSVFAQGRRFDALATLLRHPDAEDWVTRQAGDGGRSWLTLLDRYATDHLAARPTGDWLGRDAAAMGEVYDAVVALLPESAEGLRPLQDWAEPITRLLEAVYGQRLLDRYAPTDRPLVVALEQLGQVLDEVLAAEPALSPHCTFTQAVSLVVRQVSGQSIPDPGGEAAIELVGYLELLLDDAPRLAIVGMNEGHVPEPPRVSTLLSEGLRQSLGLAGDRRRLARDGYALSAMLGWREGVRLIVGKRSGAGDPLMPSRVLLQADDDTLVRRVSDFVAAEGRQTPEKYSGLLPGAGKHDRFVLPMPVLPDEPITSLRVTAFKDYLACPYRFYLKHVLKLGVLDDQAVELSASGFGTLAHEALRVLAGDELRGVADRDTIAKRLGLALDTAFTKTYGSTPPVAAQVQVEQLRYRLQAYADEHAALVDQGWRIAYAEQGCKAEVLVDGQPFTITGQIDRIDVHPELGYRLIDYKTGDSGDGPAKTHLKRVNGEPAWVDLQLPLYLDLAKALDVSGQVTLGYITLPKKASETGFKDAGWDAEQLAGAFEQRDGVIRKLRAWEVGSFWPPATPPPMFGEDGLKRLCGDDVADRKALIAASASLAQGGAS